MSSSKLLVVFGATGNQGGSVVKFVASDLSLSKEYKIRAVTRDPSKPDAQALTKLGNNSVEVVQGDLEDAASLKRVLEGAHTVFVATVSVYDGHVEEHEHKQGKGVADAAVAAGAQFIIYSSLPSIKKVSNGKLVKGGHFDSKADVEEYIRALPIKSAFYHPAWFIQNYHAGAAPTPVGDGSYALNSIVTPETRIPLIDIEDTGKFIGTILADPTKFEGKTVAGASEFKSWAEIAQAISKSTGKKVVYNQLPVEVFRGFLPPFMADYFVDMMIFLQDFSFYGPDGEKRVAQAVAEARGKPLTLDEYLEKNPLTLA